MESVATETREATPTTQAGGRGAHTGGRGGRRRTTPAQYYREVVAELRKVIYPGRKELVTYVIVVLVFVSAVTAIVAGLDYAFTKAVIAIFA